MRIKKLRLLLKVEKLTINENFEFKRTLKNKSIAITTNFRLNFRN